MLSGLKALALVAVVAFCAAAAIGAWRLADLVESVDRELPQVVSQADAVALHADAALAGIQNDSQSAALSLALAAASVQASGTAVQSVAKQVRSEIAPVGAQVDLDLQETHRLILESALTASEARQASADERAALPAMTAKANQSLDSLNSELVSLRSTTVDLDKLVSDPANAQTLRSLSDGAAELAQTAKDGQQFVHGLLHPSWPHRVYHVGLDVVHALFDPF